MRNLPRLNPIPKTLTGKLSMLAFVVFLMGLTSVVFLIQNPPAPQKTTPKGKVLATTSRDLQGTFIVNVPTNLLKKLIVSDGVDISGTTTINGEVIFTGENLDLGEGTLTASNVIYSVTAGDGLELSGGQDSVLVNTGVLSLQGVAGALSLTAGSGISISGLTISSSSTGSTEDVFKNFKVGSTSLAASGTSDTFEFSAGTNISLALDTTNKKLTITSSGGGGTFSSFDVAGDSGTAQTIEDADTLTIAGGTNGIDTVVGATDTLTLNLDTTEIGSTTFGSGSSFTWTFDAGAKDPTFTFGNTLTIQAGDSTSVSGGTLTLAGGSGGSGQDSGNASLQTSSATGGGTSGEIDIFTGFITSGSGVSGNIDIQTGNVVTGTSGTLYLASGNATGAGTSGDVNIDVGSVSGGTLGSINIGGTNATTLTLGRSGQGITLPGFTSTNGVLYGTDGTGVLAQATTSSSGLCLVSGAAAPAWTSCASSSTDDWSITSGALHPNLASTLDLLIGGTATASAKFAVLNVNGSATPIASLSATTDSGGSGNGLVLGADGTIQSLRNNTLTIGGDTTGALILKSNNQTVFSDPGGVNVIIGPFAGANFGAGSNNTFVGYSAVQDGAGGSFNSVFGTAAGSNLASGSEGNVLLGYQAGNSITTGGYNIALGYGTTVGGTTGTNNVVIGSFAGTDTNISSSIVLGESAFSTANNQLVIGSNSSAVTDVYIGEGVTSTTPQNVTINVTGESGSNQNGVNLTLAGGKGTGTGTGGSLIFSTAVQGTTGSTLQSLAERARFNYLGQFGLGTASPVSEFHVTRPLTFGALGKALAIFDQIEDQDILAASAGGTTRFVIKNDGNASSSAGFTIDAAGALQTTKNQTLTLGGDSTGNITLSPLNGSGSVIVNGTLDALTGGTATITVAASDSNARAIAQADYVGDATDDDATIETAIAALPAGGGTVYLFEGTYSIGDAAGDGIDITANNISLIGSGKGTILQRAGDAAALDGVITVTSDFVTIADLAIDGVDATYTSGNNNGVQLSTATDSVIHNIYTHDNGGRGIYLTSSSNNNTVEGNNSQSNGVDGILISSSSSNNTVTGNNSESNAGDGISIGSGTANNTVNGNNLWANSGDGIELSNSDNNSIVGNNSQSNGSHGIELTTSHQNSVIGNTIDGVGASLDGIFLSQSDNNIISGNNIVDTSGSRYGINVSNSTSDNNYIASNEISGAGFTQEINDAGTNTTIQHRDQFEIEGSNNGKALLTLNQQNTSFDILAASTSGSTVFKIDNSGNLLQNTIGTNYQGGADATGSTNSGTGGSTFNATYVSGRYAYSVKNGSATACSQSAGSAVGCELQVYDVTNPASPTYVGGADATGSTNSGTGDSSFLSIYVSGRYAYVTKNSDATACSQTAGSAIGCELQVYDVSNPASPTYVGGADASGSTNSGTGASAFLSIYVSGRYAYVTKSASATECSQTAGSAIGCELQVYDVSNPSSPAYVGGADSTGSTNSGTGIGTFNSIFVSGRYAYMPKDGDATACSQSAGSAIGCELQVYDVSNPASPTYVGGADASGSTNSGTGSNAFRSVYVSGRYAYAAKANNATACSQTAGSAIGCELQVYDVSNPASPTYVGGADASGSTNSGTGNNAFVSIFVSGRYVYVVEDGDATACSRTPGSAIGCELQVYDVTTPASPAYVGGADSTGSTNSGTGLISFNSIFVSGRYAYAARDTDATACSQTAGSAVGCELQVYDVTGIEATSVTAHSLEAGNLQVRNDILAQGQLQVAGSLTVGAGALFTGTLGVDTSSGTTALSLTQRGTGDILNLFDGTTEVFSVLDGGNVGIGDAGPDAKLEVLSTTEQLRLTHTDGTIDTRFTVDASGNLTLDASSDGTGSETLTLTGFDTLTASSLATITSAATLGISATTLNLGGGSDAVIGTTSNASLTLTPDGSGELTLTSDFDTGVNIGASSNTPAPLSVSGGIGSNAGFIVNRVGSTDDIIAASASGNTRFRIANTGELIFSDDNSAFFGTLDLTTLTADRTFTFPDAAGTVCLDSNNCAASQYWQLNTKVLSPGNSTLDLIIGGTATASAKFQFTNVISGNPTLKIFDSTSAQSLDLSHDGTDALITATSGNIKIGDGTGAVFVEDELNNPTTVNNGAIQISDKLLVQNSEAAGTALAVFDNTGAGDILTASSSGTARLVLDSTGKLGMGTVSPTSMLHVTRPLSFGATGKALAIFDQIEDQDILAASAGGITKFVLDSAGRLGIGTSSPTDFLQLENGGGIRVNNNTGNAFLILDSGKDALAGNQVSYLDFEIDDVLKGNVTVNEGTTGQPLELNSAVANDVSIANGGGDVGIGTTSPNSRLHVIGEICIETSDSNCTAASGNLQLSGTGADILFSGTSTHTISVSAGTLELGAFQLAGTLNANSQIISNAAQILITNAGGTLVFDGTAGGANEGILYNDSGGVTRYGLVFPGSDVVALANRASNGVVQIRANTSTAGSGGEVTVAEYQDNQITFLTSGGLVGIGKSSPITSLDVTRPLSAGATGKALAIFDQIEDQDILAASAGGTTRVVINNAGDVLPGADDTQDLGSTTLHWDCLFYDATSQGTCASDERLKSNFGNLDLGENPLNQLLGLKPRTFTWNDDPAQKTNYGLIAQEVAEVAPSLVETPGGNGYLQVRYGYIQYLTIEAIKQLNEKTELALLGGPGLSQAVSQITSLEAQVLDLGTRIEEIETAEPDTAVLSAENQQQLDDMLASIEQNEQDITTIQATLENHSNRLSELEDVIENGINPYSLTPFATESADFVTIDDGLLVLGTTSLGDLAVNERLAVGTTFLIENNAINTIGDQTLEIQSLRQADVSFLGGLISFEKDGKVVIEKDLDVVGKIRTGSLEGIDGPLAISGSAKLEILGIQRSEALTGSSSATINSSAGKLILKANQVSLIVNNDKVKEDSLIFITSTDSTENRALYIQSQTNGTFTVALDEALDSDITFNFLVVN